ncbi:MAG: hypothetical protein KBT36_11220 [Kurthia sp.]|nr:hypothetical protein [Candidatus Kurthia equi]
MTILMQKSKSLLIRFYNRYHERIDPFLNTVFNLVKICSTLLILWRLPFLIILFYFYIGNIVALFTAVRKETNAKALRKLIFNPYRQYKVYFLLINKENAYTNFSVGYWFLLVGLSSIAGLAPLGLLLILLFICLWPALVTTEWYYANRANVDVTSSKFKLYLPLIIQLITLNLASPFLQYRAAKRFIK